MNREPPFSQHDTVIVYACSSSNLGYIYKVLPESRIGKTALACRVWDHQLSLVPPYSTPRYPHYVVLLHLAVCGEVSVLPFLHRWLCTRHLPTLIE